MVLGRMAESGEAFWSHVCALVLIVVQFALQTVSLTTAVMRIFRQGRCQFSELPKPQHHWCDRLKGVLNCRPSRGLYTERVVSCPIHTGRGAPHNMHVRFVEHTAVNVFAQLASNIKGFARKSANACSVN